MKKVLLSLILFITFHSWAQVPQGISYQAIALDTNGNPIPNSVIGIRLSILDSSVNGSVLYTETHQVTTGRGGLFNLIIGFGTPVTGTFPAIIWGTNTKYLKVELNQTGSGSNYNYVGTTQLLSVPYALYAESAHNVNATDIIGYTDSNARTVGYMTSNTGYCFLNGYNTANQWFSQPLSGQPIKIVGSDFNIGILTSTHAYVAAINSDNNNIQWYSISLTGTPIKIIATGGKFGILTTTNAYVFSDSEDANNNVTFSWFSQSLNGTPIDIMPLFRGIGVVTTTNGYGFGKTISNTNTVSTCNWYASNPITGQFIKAMVNEDLFSIFTSTSCYTFAPVSISNAIGSFNWTSVSMNGSFIDAAK
ncbi:hypothetical protein [Flavobacterium sp. N1994]|uniref:hypothetical protein n=1 Tax=Flavobacterium sp. N1994 TaxID=2986827 RepID=UPI0022221ED0|nr:hypothetical protein [Flavobacterium sp. N1994]